MTYRIARAAGRQWTEPDSVPGLRTAVLIDGAAGSSHLEVPGCEQAAREHYRALA